MASVPLHAKSYCRHTANQRKLVGVFPLVFLLLLLFSWLIDASNQLGCVDDKLEGGHAACL